MDQSSKTTHWYIYRDDRPRVKATRDNPAKEDMNRLVSFLGECLFDFKYKSGQQPGCIGVPSSFPQAIEESLTAEGVKIIHNLPAWATEEIWIGWEET